MCFRLILCIWVRFGFFVIVCSEKLKVVCDSIRCSNIIKISVVISINI